MRLFHISPAGENDKSGSFTGFSLLREQDLTGCQ
jgi:hypothetical protein